MRSTALSALRRSPQKKATRSASAPPRSGTPPAPKATRKPKPAEGQAGRKQGEGQAGRKPAPKPTAGKPVPKPAAGKPAPKPADGKTRPVTRSQTKAPVTDALMPHGYRTIGPIAAGAFSTIVRASSVASGQEVPITGAQTRPTARRFPSLAPPVPFRPNSPCSPLLSSPHPTLPSRPSYRRLTRASRLNHPQVAIKTFDTQKCLRAPHLKLVRDRELQVLRLLRDSDPQHGEAVGIRTIPQRLMRFQRRGRIPLHYPEATSSDPAPTRWIPHPLTRSRAHPLDPASCRSHCESFGGNGESQAYPRRAAVLRR